MQVRRRDPDERREQPGRAPFLDLRLDGLVLPSGEDALGEVAVAVGCLRREGKLRKDAPVWLGVEHRAPHPGGDGPAVVDALGVGGRADRAVLLCCGHRAVSFSRRGRGHVG